MCSFSNPFGLYNYLKGFTANVRTNRVLTLLAIGNADKIFNPNLTSSSISPTRRRQSRIMYPWYGVQVDMNEEAIHDFDPSKILKLDV